MTYFVQSSTNYGSNYQAILTPILGVNTDVVLQNNGTGALQRCIPTGGYSDGNVRGSYATDLQIAPDTNTCVASGSYSVIGGGGGYSGGTGNCASGSYSSIGGGGSNLASADYSTVLAGLANQATSQNSCIGGGQDNTNTNIYTTIGGGQNNTVGYSYCTIGGGFNNSAGSQTDSIILGGYGNTCSAQENVIGGGYYNNATEYDCVIYGGYGNTSYGAANVIGGGYGNTIHMDSGDNVIAGGVTNSIGDTEVSYDSVISGGTSNKIGYQEAGQSNNCTIASGQGNIIQAGVNYSFVGGGKYNAIGKSNCGTIGGSYLVLNTATCSAACGTYNTDGSFSNGENSGDRVFMVGYGSSYGTKNLASVVGVTSGVTGGYVVADTGYLTSTGADFAEMYESLDGEAIPLGTTVTFHPGTNKIVPVPKDINPATGKKFLPIGVISNTCAYLSNSCMEYWHGMFEKDADGNSVLVDYEQEVEVPSLIIEEKEIEEPVLEDKTIFETRRVFDYENKIVKYVKTPKVVKKPVLKECNVVDENGNVVGKEKVPVTITKKIQTKVQGPLVKEKSVKKVRKESAAYRKDEKYIPRIMRKEWNIVGLLGRVKVLHGQVLGPNWIKVEEGPKYDTYIIRS